jgi:hypothetical protein
VLAVGCVVPLAAGAAGIVRGAAMLKGVHPPVSTDLNSHFRYLSGLLFGIGVAVALCVPTIERRGSLLRMIGLLVILGGLARLTSTIREGSPSAAHLGALAMELVAMPLLLLGQARVARLCGPDR